MNRALAVEPPVRIMPLGDSLTSGHSSASVPGAYRNRLHMLLTNAGYNVDFIGTISDDENPTIPDTDHQGLGSARIDQIQSNMETWLESVDDPDVVLLLIGINDFWQSYSLAGVQARLNALVSDIALKRPFAKIIVSNLPLRIDNAAIEAQQVGFNEAIPGIVAQQVALGRQVTYVDMHSAWTSSEISGDGVHPTVTGFNKMADTWFPAIAGIISPQGSSNPPLIAKTIPITDQPHVSLIFSKPVADDAANLSNFSVSGGLNVIKASLDNATKRIITLTTSTQTPGIVYSVTVSGIRDRTGAQTTIAPSSMVNFSSSAINNGSFEDDYAGWTTSGNQEIKSSAPYIATDGTRMAAFNTGQLFPNATLSRTFATTIGQIYHFEFDHGVYGYSTDVQRLQIVVQGSNNLVSEISTLNGLGGGQIKWVQKSYVFKANSNDTKIIFSDVSTSSINIDMMVDNVRVGAQKTRTLSVTSTPIEGANIVISPADIYGNANGTTGLIRSFTDGASVTVKAPTTLAGRNFLRWQRNGVDLLGSAPSITTTMNADYSLNAIYGSNNPPIAVAEAYSTTSNTPLLVPSNGVLTNDSDADASPLVAVINAPSLHGKVNLNQDGSFTYTPDNGYQGPDSFSYHANDGVSDSNVVTVALAVKAGYNQLIVNGSFESDYTGWTRAGNHLIQSAAPYTPTNGSKLLAFNAGQLSPNGVVSQSFATEPGATYQLNFDMGAFGYNTNTQRLQLGVDGSSPLLAQTLSLAGIGNGKTRWVAQSFSFVANSSKTTLAFRDVSTTGNVIDLVLDNVRVTGAPASHTLTVNSSLTSDIAVGISPPDKNANASGTTDFSRIYTEGTIANLSVPSFSGASAFVKWQQNGIDFSTNPCISLTVDANMTLTAFYGANTAPVAVADKYSILENTALIVPAKGVMSNDTDPESNTMIAVLGEGPSHGTLILSPNGGFTYVPDSEYVGPDSFSYRVNDGSLNSNLAMVSLTIIGISTGTIANGSFEDGETGWIVSGNRMVVDSASPYLSTDGRRLMVFNGTQSQPNAVISQTFITIPGETYVLGFDMGIVGATSAIQRLQINISGTSALTSRIESIIGTGLNAPRWDAKSYSFVANSTSTMIVLADVSTTTVNVDLLLDNIRLAVASSRTLTVDSSENARVPISVTPTDLNNASNGTTKFTRVFANGTDVTLTAPTTFGGGAFIKWQKDGSDFSTKASTDITLGGNTGMTAIYSINSPPVAVEEVHSLEMNASLTISAPGVLSNDTDFELHSLTAVLNAGPNHGNLTLNPDGSFSYVPNSGYSGSDTFTYHANDGFVDSNVVTVNIIVREFATGTLVNGSFEDGETGWTVTGNRLVAESSAPYIPSHGSKLMVANAGNTTPNAVISQSFATTVGKTYVLKLEMGVIAGINVQQRMLVNISGTNPLISQLETITSTSGTIATWIPKTFTFVADSSATTLALLDQSSSGTNRDLIIDNVRCSIRLDETLTVNSSPDTGLNITTTPDDLNGAGGGITNFTRIHERGSVVTVTAPAIMGTADFIKWTRNGLNFSANPSATVTMDSNQTMTAVYGINSPPLARPDSYSTNESTELAVAAPGVLANDSDENGTPIKAILVNGPSHGDLSLNPDGGFTYTPDTGYTGLDTFSYLANDNLLSSSAAIVDLNIQTIATGALANGSFEQGTIGWNLTGNNFIIDSSAPYTSTDEYKLLVFNGGQGVPNGSASQSFATTPGEQYTLDFDLGAVGTSGYQQRLQVSLIGATTLVSQQETITGIGLNSVQWTPRTHSFVANSTQTTLTFSDTSTITSNIDLLIDNIRVNSSSARTLIIDSPAGNGLNITVSPTDRAGNGNGKTPMRRYFGNGDNVTLTAPASYGGGSFIKWRKNGQEYSIEGSVSVTMDGNHTMTAIYSTPPQLLTNGSFEDAYTGWTPSGNQEIKSESPYTASNGIRLVAFNTTQTSPNGILSQTFPTISGQIYELSFDAGNYGYSTSTQRIQASVFGTVNLLSQTVSIPGLGGGATRWLPQSFTFKADSQSTTLTFRDVSTSGNSIDLVLDNVKISGYSVERSLTVESSTSNGVNISVSPADLTGNKDGITRFTRSYNTGTNVTLTAPANSAGLPFSKWSKNGADYGTNTSTTVLIDGDHTLTAVYAHNNPPLAVANSYTTSTNTPLNVSAVAGILANDSDLDDDTLTAVLDTGTTKGILKLNSDGSFTYTPNTGFQGTDSFTYHANDGLANSNLVTVSLSTTLAIPGTLINGGFENDTAGWTITGSHFIVDSDSIYTATNGVKLLVANGAQLAPSAVISQSFPTTPGESYALDFDMGIVGATNTQQRLQINIAGNTTLISKLETINGIGANTSRWLPKSFSFVANSATTTITFTDVSLSGNLVDLLLDNVRITIGTKRNLTFNTTRSSPVSVSVSPPDINGDTVGTTNFNRSYKTGAILNISAPATAGADSFIKWERNGTEFSTNGTTSLTVDGNEYITAVYSSGAAPLTRILTVNSTPVPAVSIMVSPSDNSGNGAGNTQFTRNYNNGAVVNITAPATSGGANFSKWQKNGEDLTSNATASVTMDSAHVLTAVYTTGFVNGSFESGFTGWTKAGSQETVKVNSVIPGTNGTTLVEFNSGNSALDGSLNQSFSTITGTTYTVTFDMGVLAYNTQQQKVQVSAVGASSLLSQTFALAGLGNGKIAWSSKSVSFTANGTITTLTFRDQSLTGSGLDLLLDNVNVTSPDVPITRVLTVSSTPATLVPIAISPSDNANLGSGNTQFSRNYKNGTVVSLSAPISSSGYSFSKWQKNGADLGTNTTVSVTMDAAHTLTAVYTSPPTGNSFINGSFENALTGWSVTGSKDAVITDNLLSGTNGKTLLKFNSNNSLNDGMISQTFNSIPGTTYTVIFDMGVLAYNTNNQKLEVSAMGNSSVLAETMSMNGIGNGQIRWSTKTVTFTANSASTTLTFRDQSLTGAGLDLLLDYVRVTTSNTPPPPAGSNLIANPSFELSPDFVGWTQSGSNRLEKPGPSFSTSGNNILSYSVGNTPPNGVVSQSFATIPGTTYQLEFDLGALGGVALEQRLLVGATGNGSLLSQVTSVMGRADFVMVWSHKTFSFVANTTSTTLTLSDASLSGNAMDMFVDTVSVIARSTSTQQTSVYAMEYAQQTAIEESINPGLLAPGNDLTLSGSPGAYKIAMNAIESGLYVLECSEDLQTWIKLSELEIIVPGPVVFEDNEAPKERRFYRIGKPPIKSDN